MYKQIQPGMDSRPTTTILIPHFQTADAIRLCLRSIRRYTPEPCVVRVLDNGSSGASLDYLRSVGWIDLVATGWRNNLDVGGIASAHYKALNDAVAEVETPYFLVMHSDTFVHREGWLSFLIGQLRQRDCAVVGSRHQTIPVTHSRLMCRFVARHTWITNGPLRREFKPGVAWIRSCLALYDTARFRNAGCAFATEAGEDVTHRANELLAARGEQLMALPSAVLGYYVFHKGDTTRIVNHLYSADDTELRRRRERHRRAVGQFLIRPTVQALLADPGLDR
jgi:Glycosyl transferase family 2